MSTNFAHSEFDRATHERKATGFRLTAQVYDELLKYAGKEFSAAELFSAAQKIVKLSNGKYADKVIYEQDGRPHYYALNTAAAFHYYPWLIVCIETPKMRYCDYPDYSRECLDHFREINLGMNELSWDMEI